MVIGDPSLEGEGKGGSGVLKNHSYLQHLISFKKQQKVHIAYFLYLQVQKNAYVYLDFEFLAASTHSPICVLASTTNKLCVLDAVF